MIAVDTSALMAIVLGEAEADACIAILESETEVLISAGTMAEAMIVAARRNVAAEMAGLIDGLAFDRRPCFRCGDGDSGIGPADRQGL
jgi:ribonuclease VapC